MNDLILGFIGGLITDLARGMSLDRLRTKAEKLAHPDRPVDSDDQLTVLRSIRAELREANRHAESRGAGNMPLEYVAVLWKGEGQQLPIQRNGRAHLSLMPYSPTVIITLYSPVGRVTQTLTAGSWTQIDAPIGTYYGLDAANANATEAISVRAYN